MQYPLRLHATKKNHHQTCSSSVSSVPSVVKKNHPSASATLKTAPADSRPRLAHRTHNTKLMHYKSPLHATEKYHHQTSSASVTSVPSVVKKTPLRQRYAEVRTRGLPSAARPLPPEHRTYAFPFAASHEKKSHDQSRSDSATSVPSVVQKTPLSQPPPRKSPS